MLRRFIASGQATPRGSVRGPRRHRGWWRGFALLVAGWLFVGGATPAARAQVSHEYDLKAVFLYNLASFVDWPSSAFPSPDAPFVIAVVGEDPFGPVLDDVVTNEYVGQHPLMVRRFNRSENIEGCHVLFIGQSETRRMREVLRQVRGQPVLTVGDLPGFVEAGGMVGFATQADHLQLFVNPQAMTAAALTVSSKLLEVARVINAVAVSP